MLDFAMSKAAVIAVVSLVVLGPERLPRVARTAGALLGRAQRVIDDIKSEVNREIELDKLRQWQDEMATAAHDVRHAIDAGLRQHGAELASVADAVDAQAAALRDTINVNTSAAALFEALPERDGWLSPRYDLTPQRSPRVPRKNWRAKRTVPTAWRGWTLPAQGANRRLRVGRSALATSRRRSFL
jgi:sec-independent protein translocase protein TatB